MDVMCGHLLQGCDCMTDKPSFIIDSLTCDVKVNLIIYQSICWSLSNVAVILPGFINNYLLYITADKSVRICRDQVC